MSARKTVATATPEAPALPSLYDIGRQIVAIAGLYDVYDDEERKLEGDTLRQDNGLRWNTVKKAMKLLFSQEDALTDLGLSIVPETLVDAAVILSLASRRLDELDGHGHSKDEMRRLAGAGLQAIRASLPIIARAAGIEMDAFDPSGGHLSAIARPKLWKPEAP